MDEVGPNQHMGATGRIDSLFTWVPQVALTYCAQRNNRGFRLRLDFLDRKISLAARNNASMRHVAPCED